jgi:hypothetical protein
MCERRMVYFECFEEFQEGNPFKLLNSPFFRIAARELNGEGTVVDGYIQYLTNLRMTCGNSIRLQIIFVHDCYNSYSLLTRECDGFHRRVLVGVLALLQFRCLLAGLPYLRTLPEWIQQWEPELQTMASKAAITKLSIGP